MSQDFWKAGVGVLEARVGREFHSEELRPDGLDLPGAIVPQGIK